jgi:hypothetical protein
MKLHGNARLSVKGRELLHARARPGELEHLTTDLWWVPPGHLESSELPDDSRNPTPSNPGQITVSTEPGEVQFWPTRRR